MLKGTEFYKYVKTQVTACALHFNQVRNAAIVFTTEESFGLIEFKANKIISKCSSIVCRDGNSLYKNRHRTVERISDDLWVSSCCFCVDVQILICYTVLWNCLQLVHCICKMPPAKHQIRLYDTHQSYKLYT